MKNITYHLFWLNINIFLLITFSYNGYSQDELVKLSGVFSVSDAGAASYSLPIDLPLGAGGMKPSLSINYNSSGSNGIMGIGWGLSGMSVISRGSKTIAQDGVNEKVNFDWNDVYYLDGERLVLTTDQYEYGKDGANYGTETNSYMKITSIRESGMGSYSFEVRTKTGLIMKFGTKDESRIYAKGKQEIMYWLLSEISDTKGNYMQYDYEKDEANGTYVPTSIRYTRNNNVSTEFLTQVLFEYEGRNETDYVYINGIKQKITKRLKRIKIVHKNIVKDIYTFDYTEYGEGKNSLLTSIQNCIDQKCADPIVFDWETGNQTFSLQQPDKNIFSINDIKGTNNELRAINLNNDGLDDILLIDQVNNSFKVYICLGNGKFLLRASNLGTFTEQTTIQIIDANSDGVDDIFGWNSLTGENFWYINSPNKSNEFVTLFNPTSSNYIPTSILKPTSGSNIKQIYFLDYDGDSRKDILIIDPSNGNHTLFRNESGYSIDNFSLINVTAEINIGISKSVFKNNILIPADFDSDGKDDFLFYSKDELTETTNNYWYRNSFSNGNAIYTSIGSNLISWKYFSAHPIEQKRTADSDDYGDSINWPLVANARHPYLTDINGDGNIDLIFTPYFLHFWHIYTSGDNEFYYFINDQFIDVFINKGNFTFDGPRRLTDEAKLVNQQPADGCFLSFHVIEENKHKEGKSWQNIPSFFDVNGDGKSDMFTYRYESNVGSSINGRLLFNTKLNTSNKYCDNWAWYNDDQENKLTKSHIPVFGRFNRFGLDILMYNNKTGETQLHKNNSDARHPVISSIWGQMGGDINISYASLNDTSVYIKGKDRFYPEIDYASSSLVVKEYFQLGLDLPEPIVHNQYKYYDGRVNLIGRGFRGFTKVEIKDHINELRAVKVYEDDSRLIGSALRETKTYTFDGNLVSEERHYNVQMDYSSGGTIGETPIFITTNTIQDKMFTTYPVRSVIKSYELNGSLISTIENRTRIDFWGNIVYQAYDYGDGCIDSIYNEYSNDFDRFIIGRLTKSTVYKKCQGSNDVIRESEFEYDPISGLLVREVSEPNQSIELRSEKTYKHDVWGNIVESTTKAWNGNQVEIRVLKTKFDSEGRFQIETRNSLNYVTNTTYDHYRGNPLTNTDENGLTTTFEYDPFGKVINSIYPDGNYSHLKTYNDSYIKSDATFSNMPAAFANYDIAGREVESSIISFNGNLISESTNYSKGRIVSQSEPSQWVPVVYTYFEYDKVGRNISTENSVEFSFPGQKYTTSYNGLTTTYSNPLQQKLTTTKDSHGRIIKNIDNAGNQIHYSYDSQNNLIKVSAGQNEYNITYEYDLKGRLTKMTDPILGTEIYTYDGYGNLLKKIDGGGDVFEYTYDKLNRLISLKQAEGTIHYTYDEGLNAIGKLTKIAYNNYEKKIKYDNLGRENEITITIDGNSHVYKLYYNGLGKVDRLEHPIGITLKYHYNDNFYLYKISNYQTGKTIWEALSMDEKNRVTEEIFGNNLINKYGYDRFDNLSYMQTLNGDNQINYIEYEYNDLNNKASKTDYYPTKVEEQYEYDNLNRLIGVIKKSNGVSDTLAMTYDKWGNIITKSDVGTYRYKNITQLERIDFFEKDCYLPSTLFNYEYTSFDKLKKVKGDKNSLDIIYGPDNHRIRQNLYKEDILTETRTYVSSDYELIKVNDKTTKRFTLNAPSGSIAIYEITDQQPLKINYLHKDDLGSIILITDDKGLEKHRYSYDAWGKRMISNLSTDSTFSKMYRGFTGHEHIDLFDLVNMNGRVYDPVLGRFLTADPFIQDNSDFQNFNRYSYVRNNPINLIDPSGYFSLGKTFKKFTKGVSRIYDKIDKGIGLIASGQVRSGLKNLGQSYIDIYYKGLGLKEMNARGRKAFGEETWNQMVVASATIVVASATAGSGTTFALQLGYSIMSGAAAGFTGGALSAAMSGGRPGDILESGLRGAAISGISAGLTYGVGHNGLMEGTGAISNNFAREGLRAVGHGLVQGGMNEIQGDKFSHGFYTGLVSSIGSHAEGFYGNSRAGRVFASSLVGGSVSAITGGKFATGAVSGAFVEMFNNEKTLKIETGVEAPIDPICSLNSSLDLTCGIGPYSYSSSGDYSLSISPSTYVIANPNTNEIGVGFSTPLPKVKAFIELRYKMRPTNYNDKKFDMYKHQWYGL